MPCGRSKAKTLPSAGSDDMYCTGHELSAATRRWMLCGRSKIFAATGIGRRTFFASGHNMECGQQSSTKMIGGNLMCNHNGICGCFSGNNWWWIIVLLLIFCNPTAMTAAAATTTAAAAKRRVAAGNAGLSDLFVTPSCLPDSLLRAKSRKEGAPTGAPDFYADIQISVYHPV